MSSRTAARRVASTSVDSLRKRERQIMAAAYDLAKKDGAFSISFVAKKTSVKALIYFSAPKSAADHLDAEEAEDVEDGAVVEEGGRAMPSSAKEPHRARREANPPPPRPMQPNVLLGLQMALMCIVRRALRRRRRPRAKSPRLLALIATPSAPALTAHHSALIPRLNRRLLALCRVVRWYALALGQAMRWMKMPVLLPRKRRLLCVQHRREPMSTRFRVAHGAAAQPTHRRATVDGRQADAAGTPEAVTGRGGGHPT